MDASTFINDPARQQSTGSLMAVDTSPVAAPSSSSSFSSPSSVLPPPAIGPTTTTGPTPVSASSTNVTLASSAATSPPKSNDTDAFSHEKGISEILECPICQDIFRDACETICGHTFCEFCINKWLEKHTTCPVCSAKEARPIHASFTLREVVRAYKKFASIPDDNSLIDTDSGITIDFEEAKRKGNDAYNRSEFALAIDFYSRAIKKAPHDHVLYSNRAQAYIRLGQFRRALDDVERTLALCPTSVKALIRKSKCLEELGEVNAALLAMKNAKQVSNSGEFENEINSNLIRLQALTRVPAPSVAASSSASAPQQMPPQAPAFSYYTPSPAAWSSTSSPAPPPSAAAYPYYSYPAAPPPAAAPVLPPPPAAAVPPASRSSSSSNAVPPPVYHARPPNSGSSGGNNSRRSRNQNECVVM